MKSLKKTLGLLLAAAMLLALLSGCGAGGMTPEAPQGASGGAAGAEGSAEAGTEKIPEIAPMSMEMNQDVYRAEGDAVIRLISCSYAEETGFEFLVEIDDQKALEDWETSREFDLVIGINGYYNCEGDMSIRLADTGEETGFVDMDAYFLTYEIYQEPGLQKYILSFSPIDDPEYRRLAPITPLRSLSVRYMGYGAYVSGTTRFYGVLGTCEVAVSDEAADAPETLELFSDDRVRIEGLGYIEDACSQLMGFTRLDGADAGSNYALVPELGSIYNIGFESLLTPERRTVARVYLSYGGLNIYDCTLRPGDTVLKVVNLSYALPEYSVNSPLELKLNLEGDWIDGTGPVLTAPLDPGGSLPDIESVPVIFENESLRIRERPATDGRNTTLSVFLENKTDDELILSFNTGVPSSGDVEAYLENGWGEPESIPAGKTIVTSLSAADSYNAGYKSPNFRGSEGFVPLGGIGSLDCLVNTFSRDVAGYISSEPTGSFQVSLRREPTDAAASAQGGSTGDAPGTVENAAGSLVENVTVENGDPIPFTELVWGSSYEDAVRYHGCEASGSGDITDGESDTVIGMYYYFKDAVYDGLPCAVYYFFEDNELYCAEVEFRFQSEEDCLFVCNEYIGAYMNRYGEPTETWESDEDSQPEGRTAYVSWDIDEDDYVCIEYIHDSRTLPGVGPVDVNLVQICYGLYEA